MELARKQNQTDASEAPPTGTTADKLSSFADSAASQERESSGGFMNPGQQAKRGRGRPKGSTKKEEVPPPPIQTHTKEYLKPAFEMLSNLSVRLTGEQQAGMKPEELEIITTSGAACIDQYLPAMLSQHANLMVFSMAFGSWSLRVWMIYQTKKEILEEMRRRSEEMNGASHPADAHPVN